MRKTNTDRAAVINRKFEEEGQDTQRFWHVNQIFCRFYEIILYTSLYMLL